MSRGWNEWFAINQTVSSQVKSLHRRVVQRVLIIVIWIKMVITTMIKVMVSKS